jgi:hypothetical protein
MSGWTREHGLALGTMGLLGVGLMTSVLAQVHGTATGTPERGLRIAWALFPFLLAGLALRWSAAVRAYDAGLAVLALLLWTSCVLYTDDEMRLSYWYTPALQTAVTIPVLAGLAAYRWWVGKRQRRASE